MGTGFLDLLWPALILSGCIILTKWFSQITSKPKQALSSSEPDHWQWLDSEISNAQAHADQIFVSVTKIDKNWWLSCSIPPLLDAKRKQDNLAWLFGTNLELQESLRLDSKNICMTMSDEDFQRLMSPYENKKENLAFLDSIATSSTPTSKRFHFSKTYNRVQKSVLKDWFPFLKRPHDFLELEALFAARASGSSDATKAHATKLLQDFKPLKKYLDAQNVYALLSVAQLVSLIVDDLCQPERRARAGDEFFTRALDYGVEPEMNVSILALVDTLDDDRREKMVDYIQKLSPEKHAAAEHWLLHVLRCGEPTLLAFAAECLGHVGRRTAVLQLHDLKKEYFGISFTADVIEDAIARIQARLPESEVGALALTSEEKEKGQLSLSAAKQGAMSLKNK